MFVQSLSTVIESLLVYPCCCVLLIGDFNDSLGNPIQLQTSLFRIFSAYCLQQLIDSLSREYTVRFLIRFEQIYSSLYFGMVFQTPSAT